MKDSTLLRIAVIVSFLGVFCLGIISRYTTVEETTIVDDEIILKGKIVEVKGYNGITKITLLHKTEMMLFENISGLRVSDEVRVIAYPSSYKGKREIICEKIEVSPE